MSSAAGDLADGLSKSIIDNDDLATVEDGGPAYLLLIDGLLYRSPKNEGLLRAGAGLYSTYATAFVTDPGRAARMTEKALGYGQAALCVRRDSACDLRTAPFEDFEAAAATLRKKDVPAMYALGSAWAAWIQVRQDDFEAVAQLARVQALMNRVLELDEAYMGGGAHLYLGVLKTLIPPAMGGRPEEAREHFERVIQLSDGRNLMAKVLYARQYAKMMFDRELHDRLLNEVLATEPRQPGYTLTNMWAREMAQKMLSEADDYFF